jgi:hypothetical protein
MWCKAEASTVASHVITQPNLFLFCGAFSNFCCKATEMYSGGLHISFIVITICLIKSHLARMRKKNNVCRVWWGHLKERDLLEDLDVDGRILLEWGLEEIGWDCVDWIDLVVERDRWRTIVNTVMNLGVPYIAVNFLSSWGNIKSSVRTPPWSCLIESHPVVNHLLFVLDEKKMEENSTHI